MIWRWIMRKKDPQPEPAIDPTLVQRDQNLRHLLDTYNASTQQLHELIERKRQA